MAVCLSCRLMKHQPVTLMNSKSPAIDKRDRSHRVRRLQAGFWRWALWSASLALPPMCWAFLNAPSVSSGAVLRWCKPLLYIRLGKGVLKVLGGGGAWGSLWQILVRYAEIRTSLMGMPRSSPNLDTHVSWPVDPYIHPSKFWINPAVSSL